MPKNTQNLKIAYVIDDGLDRLDGVQQYVLTIGNWMKAQGHEVHYLAGQTTRKDIENVHSMSKNLRVQFNGNGLTTPFPAPKRRIREVLDGEQFDVIHVQVPYSPFMAGRVVRRAYKNSVIVGTFHILPYGLLANLGNRGLGLLLRRNLRYFDAQLAVSPPASKFARDSFGIRPTTVPNAVDFSKFRLIKTRNTSKKTISLVFLGRLVERKGCHRLLYALKQLIKLGATEVRLTICGDGPDRTRLEKYVADNELNDYVNFLGFVDEEEKSKAIGSADIAVFPSTSGESFGIVLIEAMASGAGVVIGGNNPGYSSVLEADKRVLFDPRDTDEFSSLLFNLINSPDDRKEIHSFQQNLVKKYDVNVVAKEVLEVYLDCIKAKD